MCYIKMAFSGALWSMDFKLNHVPACSCADRVPVLNKADHFGLDGVCTHPSQAMIYKNPTNSLVIRAGI